MTFPQEARRVRDSALPLDVRHRALRQAVWRYRPVGFDRTWALIMPGGGPWLSEADLLKALQRLERSRGPWLAEMEAFGLRRKHQKRERIPVDREEVRYRYGRRWPGPDAEAAAPAIVSGAWRRRTAYRRFPLSLPELEPFEADLGAIVDALTGDRFGVAERRRLGEVLDRVEAGAEEFVRHHGLGTAMTEYREIGELIRCNALPFVRRGWVGDAKRLTAVFWAARSEMEYLPALYTYEQTAWWVEHVMCPQSELWVAERHGVPVGFAALNGDWLDHLYVEPSAQGQGAGEALLAKAKRRRSELRLRVFEQNTGARAFYERQGFTIVSTSDGSDNEERLPDLHLRWQKRRR